MLAYLLLLPLLCTSLPTQSSERSLSPRQHPFPALSPSKFPAVYGIYQDIDPLQAFSPPLGGDAPWTDGCPGAINLLCDSISGTNGNFTSFDNWVQSLNGRCVASALIPQVYGVESRDVCVDGYLQPMLKAFDPHKFNRVSVNVVVDGTKPEYMIEGPAA